MRIGILMHKMTIIKNILCIILILFFCIINFLDDYIYGFITLLSFFPTIVGIGFLIWGLCKRRMVALMVELFYGVSLLITGIALIPFTIAVCAYHQNYDIFSLSFIILISIFIIYGVLILIYYGESKKLYK